LLFHNLSDSVILPEQGLQLTSGHWEQLLVEELIPDESEVKGTP
jgi:hypothetical protein